MGQGERAFQARPPHGTEASRNERRVAGGARRACLVQRVPGRGRDEGAEGTARRRVHRGSPPGCVGWGSRTPARTYLPFR